MAHSVTGLFADQTRIDHVVGALRDASFEADRISVVSPDADMGMETTQEPGGRGVGAWIVDHLRGRGVAHDHARRYQQHVATGRHLVSVSVETDAEDHAARGIMVALGAEEISSFADGTMRPVHPAPGGG